MAKKTRSFKPVPGDVMPRFAGIASFMRLPLAEDWRDVEIGLAGATMMYEIPCPMAGRVAAAKRG